MVSKNIIHDIKCAVYGAWGIYLDEGSSFITVEKNIVYNTERESFHLHYGSHNTVRDNLFFGKNSCVRIGRDEDHDQLCLEGNLLVTDGAPIYGGLRRDPLWLSSNMNVLCDINNEAPVLWRSDDGRTYDLKEWREKFKNDNDSLSEASVDGALCRYGMWKLEGILDADIDIKHIVFGK